MLTQMVLSVVISLKQFSRDKFLILLSILPVLVAFALFKLLNSMTPEILSWLGVELPGDRFWRAIVDWIIYIAELLLILLFAADIISSPFLDIISARIERHEKGEPQLPPFESIKMSLRRFSSTLKNEIKKIIFLITLAATALGLGLIPGLQPFSLMIFALCISIQFVDYNWSRNELSFAACLKDIVANLITYLVMGWIFLFFISIPFMGFFVLPLATSYYSTYWSRRNK